MLAEAELPRVPDRRLVEEALLRAEEVRLWDPLEELILVLEDDVVVAKVEEELSIFAVKVGKLDEVVEVITFAELEEIGESAELKLI